MRRGKNILNNLMLSNLRKNQIYQAILTDLAITDNIEREDAEMLLGYKIPSYLKTPDGGHLSDYDNYDDDDDDDNDDDGVDKNKNTKSSIKK